MNILITHFFNKDNKGDAAILSVIIAQLRQRIPNGSLNVLTTRYAVAGEKFENVPLHNVITYTGEDLFVRRIKSLLVIVITTLWALIYRLTGRTVDLKWLCQKHIRRLIKLYQDADLVTPTGGGYITAKNTLEGNLHMVQQLHIIFLAKLLGKKVFMWPQSFGPFGNRFQRTLARLALNRVNVICVRENISQEVLADIGVRRPEILPSSDMAFGFNPDTKDMMREELVTLGLDFNRSILGVTVRQWFKGEQQQTYEKAIAEFVSAVVAEQNIQVVFIPQVTATKFNDDDRIVARRIQQSVQGVPNIIFLEKNYDYKQVKGIYENLNYMIGTRMHSVIFALTSQVPSIAIEYEHKTSGIMKSLGLGDFVIGIDKLSPEILNDVFQELRSKFSGSGPGEIIISHTAINRLLDLFKSDKSIQVLVNLFYPYMGGLERNARHLYKGLVEFGWAVKVFTHRHSQEDRALLPEQEIIDGISVQRFSHYNFAYGPFALGINYASRGVIVLHDLLAAPFVFVSLYVTVLKLLRRKNFKFVFSSHGYMNSRRLFNKTLKSKIETFVDQRIGIPLLNFSVDAVRAVSKAEADLLKKKGLRRPIISVIGNGLEPEALMPVNPAVTGDFKDKVRRLERYYIHLARIDRFKNFELGVKALRYLPSDLKFVIVGPTETANQQYLDSLKAIIQECSLEDRVIFWGRADGAEKYYLLRNALVSIHPSWYEGFGTSILESLSQGCVCVVSKGTGCEELIKEGINGFLVDPNDPEQLASSIKYVISDAHQTEIKVIKANNVEKAKKYTWDRVIKEVEALYS